MRVQNAQVACKIAARFLLQDNTPHYQFGLAEFDDRLDAWRVPLVANNVGFIGEIVIQAETSQVIQHLTTSREMRLERLHTIPLVQKPSGNNAGGNTHSLPNLVLLGKCQEVMQRLPDGAVDLVFTSPPYFNARIEYSEYVSYQDYLDFMREVFTIIHSKLADGRFIVINISPVLIRRTRRSESSRRLAVPFDYHSLLTAVGFEFIDDIHWVKPEGAGWATGRGRRFAADRTPLQYKPVPVTEYVLVYRKATSHLIDWNIRKHPRPEDVKASRIDGDYERTNIWRITPRSHSKHPAVFPHALAEKVISYYSFRSDVVLDPFAGSGTTALAASALERKFIAIEANDDYYNLAVKELDIAGATYQKELP